MRIVLDTNVFVSAVLKTNSVPFLAVRWVAQQGELLKSAETEQELLDVIHRPRLTTITTPGFQTGVEMMLARAELVPITERMSLAETPRTTSF